MRSALTIEAHEKALVLTANATISVIDDDPSVRTSIDDLLKSSGYWTNMFGRAEGFLSSSALWNSDCVISDVEMPGTSGVELLRFFQANKIETPLIVMSAGPKGSVFAETPPSGAFAFVEKPFLPERFLDLISLALQQSSRYRRVID
jgi:two-component system response regulator FixJ